MNTTPNQHPSQIKSILVTGANGAMGSYVPEVFQDVDLTLTDITGELQSLDIREPKTVMHAVADLQPDIVLHLAAATNVDRCQQEPDWAYHTNAIGTQNVALACQKHNKLLIYISTAGVFWGDKTTPYNEYDTPRPANIYGESKLAGEQTVMTLLNRFYIVRAGWMIGGGLKDTKFVAKVGRQMVAGKTSIKAVDDKFGSCTYAKDFVYGIRDLLATDYYGLYHLVNQGWCSRYEVALAIRDALQRPDITVEPVSSAHFPLPAPRARSEAMRNMKLELLGLTPRRSWQEALQEYVTTELGPALTEDQNK